MENHKKGADLKTASKSLPLIIESKNFDWGKQYITGREVRDLVKASEEVELFLAIRKPWEDELILDDDKVDLARPGIEKFFFKDILLLTIDGKKYKWYEQYITGEQLKELAQISLEDELFLKIQNPWKDELIENATIVDLARPGIEHFFSKEVDRDIAIIVNSREKPWNKKSISFDEIIILKDGANNSNKAYTITYKDGPQQNPSGELAKGETVFVKNKMKFYVTATDKS